MKNSFLLAVLFISGVRVYGQEEVLYPEEPAYFEQGGEQGLIELISSNFKYPIESRNYCRKGKVLVEFVVSKTGSLDEVKCVNYIDEYIDKEAIRLIMLSDNNWKPAVLNGEIVDSRMVLPITFDHKDKACEKKLEKLLVKGQIEFSKNRFDEAIKKLSLALKFELSNSEALITRGLSYYKLNKVDSACIGIN